MCHDEQFKTSSSVTPAHKTSCHKVGHMLLWFTKPVHKVLLWLKLSLSQKEELGDTLQILFVRRMQHKKDFYRQNNLKILGLISKNLVL